PRLEPVEVALQCLDASGDRMNVRIVKRRQPHLAGEVDDARVRPDAVLRSRVGSHEDDAAAGDSHCFGPAPGAIDGVDGAVGQEDLGGWARGRGRQRDERQSGEESQGQSAPAHFAPLILAALAMVFTTSSARAFGIGIDRLYWAIFQDPSGCRRSTPEPRQVPYDAFSRTSSNQATRRSGAKETQRAVVLYVQPLPFAKSESAPFG